MEQTADRVVIVGAGRLVREGTLADLRAGADGTGTVRVRTPSAARLAELLRTGGATVTVEGDTLTVTGRSTAQVGHAAYEAGIELHELRTESSDLEAIYFQLTAGQEQYSGPAAGAGEVR
jgi:ABC-2 type transport system ATP-binding protein